MSDREDHFESEGRRRRHQLPFRDRRTEPDGPVRRHEIDEAGDRTSYSRSTRRPHYYPQETDPRYPDRRRSASRDVSQDQRRSSQDQRRPSQDQRRPSQDRRRPSPTSRRRQRDRSPSFPPQSSNSQPSIYNRDSTGDVSRAHRFSDGDILRPPPGRASGRSKAFGKPDFVHPRSGEGPMYSSSPPSPVVVTAVKNGHYPYQPLEESCIRLIKLFPERKTRINCQLVPVSLDDAPPFIAVSYAWGDATLTREIELEGSLIPISLSLHGALNAIRHKKDTLYVWADALAINQQDSDERMQQVSLMTRIYQTAKSVAIWLGPDENESQLAVDFLYRLARRKGSPRDVARLLTSPDASPAVSAVVSLFERDYWSRLWVVQEVLLATSITVYCGSTVTPWNVYVQASDAIRELGSGIQNLFEQTWDDQGQPINVSAKRRLYMDVLRHRGPAQLPSVDGFAIFSSDKQTVFINLLCSCREKLASDPRDKLFGLLGILPTEIRLEFRPNYDRSVKEVYTDIVDYFVKTTRNLNIICEAGLRKQKAGLKLPTFVPDWSDGYSAWSLRASNLSPPRCRASGNLGADSRWLGDRMNQLEISAITIGSLYVCGITFGAAGPGESRNDDNSLLAFVHWRALVNKFCSNRSRRTRQSAMERFAMTLTAGHIPPPWKTPEEWATVCYHVFACYLQQVPIPLDEELSSYLDLDMGVGSWERRKRVAGRALDIAATGCFFITTTGDMGVGWGKFEASDTLVVPLGCDMPVVLRRCIKSDEYELVSDVYVHGYMEGEAVRGWKDGRLKTEKYVLR